MPSKADNQFVEEIVRKYCYLYNREVREFYHINNSSLNDICKGSRIHEDSKVLNYESHLSGRKAWVTGDIVNKEATRDVDAEEAAKLQRLIRHDKRFRRRLQGKIHPFQMGTYWRGWEKRLFFKLLSRYSIHRLDEWCHMLPLKSKFEILSYYRVLKHSLEFMKNTKKTSLLKRNELPIAYEMNEEYIAIEEYLSGKLREFEGSEALAGIAENPKIESQQEEKNELISLDVWNRRWHGIYRRSQIEEIKGQQVKYRNPLELANKDEIIPYLDSILKRYLRKLLWYTVLPNIQKISIRKGELTQIFNGEQHEFSPGSDVKDIEEDGTINVRHSKQKRFLPCVITEANVSDAIATMKMEHKRCNTLAESIVDTIHKFELYIRPASNKVFIGKRVAQTVLPRLISQQLIQERMLNCTNMIPELDLVTGDEEYNKFVKFKRRRLLRLTKRKANKIKAELKGAVIRHRRNNMALEEEEDDDNYNDIDNDNVYEGGYYEDSENEQILTEPGEDEDGENIAESAQFNNTKQPKTTEEHFAEKCSRIWGKLRKERANSNPETSSEQGPGEEEEEDNESFPPKPFVIVKDVNYDMDTVMKDGLEPAKILKVSTRLDNPVELDLLNWETEITEQQDRRSSMLHQTALINYLFQHDKKFVPLAYEPDELLQDVPECPYKIPRVLTEWFFRSD